MAFHKPETIASVAIEAGVNKLKLSISTVLALGFLGGVFISFGFLLDIRVIGNVPEHWGSLASFLGAAVFPLGLILVVLAGGELITGNMMTVSMAFYARKISFISLIKNWCIVTFANFSGAIFVAYFFGHIVGLTEMEPYLHKTVSIAHTKLHESFIQILISAIGCNWLVCLAIWLAYSTDDFVGKVIGIWFPIMAFVAIGFQQVVANMFVIPAAIFAGYFSWVDCIKNIIPTFIGNVIGGAVFVGFAYYASYKKQNHNHFSKKIS
ncbi:formate/nitrite transporter family protein [Heyndrickxia ginsengihumi]|uniref:Formate/nitrite transporter n=1 Tax=Heyndrickxia ginsengihumi TaxID=363870 RepID=A0A0A6VCS9_9BACI|nr:formate/nitrite transporter family protein [Heyndrickxia ginsengihumi]KHD86110.1 formate/nitrite transporter [Heyndrickxia ginsengihumi]MBE6184764.1 formate/nitrite transporter family protein [Bacillus sp. (in: firmicutes)]MCM3023394.1 formate/nitrite transporter family protein [Heyndrickxia ginsengihumi]NEY21331.1 formate/nitrite transporter family protein [Heyndrickxia ginsengihumi]